MKRLVPLLAVLVAGCVIHAVNPIGTAKSEVTPKHFLGQWQLVRGPGEKDLAGKSISPWALDLAGRGENAFKLTAFDEQNARAEFKTRFFQIGAGTFLDVVPGNLDPEVKLNAYWFMSVHPVHGVAKVVATNDELRLHLLSYDWVKTGLKAKTITLPYAGTLDEFILITATSPEWEAFLIQYGSDTNAFPTEATFVLKHVVPDKTP
jgi:hypothetical protein